MTQTMPQPGDTHSIISGTASLDYLVKQIVTLSDLAAVMHETVVNQNIREAAIPEPPNLSGIADPLEFSRRAAQWLNSNSPFIPLLGEMVLCRAVDGYLTYLSELITAVYRARPETLKSEEKVTVEFILNHESMDELILALVDQRVNKLAYKSVTDLNSYVAIGTGLNIFQNDQQKENTVRIVETRNIIVHNRGIVNDKHLKNVPGTPLKIGDHVSLNFADILMDMYTLLIVATEMDRLAVTKFGLPTCPISVRTMPNTGIDGSAIRMPSDATEREG